MFTYLLSLQFITVGEMLYFRTLINTPFDKERILITNYILWKDTLHKSC